MNNAEYTSAVDRGEWPSDPAVPLDAPFVNHNGTIQNLVLKPMQSVTRLDSVKGAVRANHYHLSDWHYTAIMSGSIAYYERAIGSTDLPEPTIFRKGDMFFTPPMREHAMVFLEESVIITMAKNVRSHEEHEADLVRIQVVDPANVPDIIARLAVLR